MRLWKEIKFLPWGHLCSQKCGRVFTWLCHLGHATVEMLKKGCYKHQDQGPILDSRAEGLM